MSNDNTQDALVPRLRFPEFRNSPEWKVVPLAKLLARDPEYGVNAAAVPYSEGLPAYIRITDIDDDGCYLREGRVSVDIEATDNDFLQDGDIALARTGASVGKSYRYRPEDGRLVFAGFLIRVRPKPTKLDSRFLAAYLSTGQYWEWVRITSARSGQPGINGSEYASMPLPVPTDDDSNEEQQKIAEFLGSLDDLIAAEGRKLETLRNHKKGLMQQLFPREGETRPRLRFPEFQDAPEWKETKAGTLFSQRKEKGEAGLPIYSVTINDGMILRSTFDRNFYDIEDPAGNKKAYKNDIAYNMMRMWQGACGVAAEDCMVSPAYVVLNPKKGTCPGFFDVLFKRPETLHLLTVYSRGLTLDRLRLYFDDFTSIPLLVPTEPEQQRIADCLASLDTMIAAQSQKLDALRTHKRGLMQQLFPSPEDV